MGAGERRGTSTGPRVLHLVPTFLDEGGRITGGGERYVFELARHMADVVPTRLVTFGTPAEPPESGNLSVRIASGAIHVRGQIGNPLHPVIMREVLAADVVHTHQTHVLMSSLTALLGRLVRRPVFTTDLGGGGWDVSAYVPTDRWFRGHLHISEYSRTVYGHGTDPRARVILGGVDTAKFSPKAARPGRDFVLFVGRLLPHKGIDDLIRAMPDDLPLLVVGRIHERAYYDQLREIARGKRVEFRHDVDDAGLVALYREALCLVLPSVYRPSAGGETQVPELLGQTLLEAMACGTPAVCTDVASMPEVVDDGATGFVVPPNDPAAMREKLQWLRSNVAHASSMGERARARVLEHFSWPAVVDRCLGAYAELGS